MKPVESLDIFLSRIEAHLGDLPDARRAEILAETRAHLEAMLAANRADGLSEVAAWQKTARDFGDADQIGRDLASEWKRAPRVETVGAPLTKREKLKMFVRAVAISLFFLTFFSLKGAFRSQGQQWEVVWPLMSLVGAGLGLRLWRKRGGQWTFPLVCFLAGCSVAFVGVSLDQILGSQGHETWRNTISQTWPYLSFVLMAIAIPWFPRAIKTAFPWRQMPLYAQNPIAAEETYRLAPRLALISSSTLGCILFLWMGWREMGLQFAALMCMMEITVTFLFLRQLP